MVSNIFNLGTATFSFAIIFFNIIIIGIIVSWDFDNSFLNSFALLFNIYLYVNKRLVL